MPRKSPSAPGVEVAMMALHHRTGHPVDHSERAPDPTERRSRIDRWVPVHLLEAYRLGWSAAALTSVSRAIVAYGGSDEALRPRPGSTNPGTRSLNAWNASSSRAAQYRIRTSPGCRWYSVRNSSALRARARRAHQ